MRLGRLGGRAPRLGSQFIYFVPKRNITELFVLLAGQRAFTSGHCFQREKRRGRGHIFTYSVPASEDIQNGKEGCY